MRIKDKRKLLLSLLLITIILTTNIEKSYAVTVGFGSLSEGGSGGVERPYETVSGENYDPSGTKKHFEYGYEKSVHSSIAVTIDGYDLEGNAVMPITTIIDHTKYTFKAGTWIGIYILETQSVNWDIKNFKASEVKKEYKCVYSKSSTLGRCPDYDNQYSSTEDLCDGIWTKNGNNIMGTCTPYKTCTRTYDDKTYTPPKQDYNANYSCPAAYPYDTSFNILKSQTSTDVYETASAEYAEQMKDKLYREVHAEALGKIGASLGKVQYITTNNYPESGVFDSDDIGELEVEQIEFADSGIGATGSAHVTYNHTQKQVCMNLKTSKVTYGRNCETDEIQIETNPEYNYWHYFIPLNAKSGTKTFYLEVIANENKKLTVKECKNAMEKYSLNYPDIIIPNLTGDKFDLSRSQQYNEHLVEENGGCYFATSIYIPVKQGFYNEISDGTFKGFNFYYRPIDVNNPFPNGIPTNSIWTEEKTNNLTGTSMEEENITYVANVANANALREYNDDMITHGDYSYTRWENMYINGISNFVENSGFVKRYVNKSDIYKLGCGPANKNATNEDGTTNYMYQEECGT